VHLVAFFNKEMCYDVNCNFVFPRHLNCRLLER